MKLFFSAVIFFSSQIAFAAAYSDEGYKVYIYNSPTVIYALTDSHDRIRVREAKANANYRYEITYWENGYANLMTNYQCQVRHRIRAADGYGLTLTCTRVLGDMISRNAVELKIEGTLDNQGGATGTLTWNGVTSEFEAFDPELEGIDAD